LNPTGNPRDTPDIAANRSINVASLRPVACDSLVRMGSPNDGGYVVPLSAVKTADALLSFGLSHDWSFEREFRKLNPDSPIHCYDNTVSFLTTAEYSVRQLLRSVLQLNASSLRKAAAWLDYATFFRGNVVHFRNRIWRDRQRDSATVDDAFSRLSGERPVFVKMDIEGSEYRVFEDVLRHGDTIEAIAVEFHDIDLLRQRFDELIDKAKEQFHIVHVHANNIVGLAPGNFPIVLELTFLNKRRFTAPALPSLAEYPIPGLDQPNDPRSPDLKLGF
jgi:hypothetical protein